MGELYSELGRLLSANHADDLAFLVHYTNPMFL